jgi:GT2 family glycosyltransferase
LNHEDGGVSVVMITRDRLAEAHVAVERLLSLPEKPPVVVVDNGSTDGTAEQLQRRFEGRATIIPLSRNAGAAGRNVGVEAVSTPYVAFSDDDSGWVAGSLRRAGSILDAHPRLAVLAAAVFVESMATLDPTCEEMAASPLAPQADLPGPSVLGFLACGAVVRREAFLEVGGFDERYGVGGEEGPLSIELAARGWGLAYVDHVTALHWPSPIRDPSARRRAVVRNRLWLAWGRRHWTTAVRTTSRSARSAVTDSASRAGLWDAVRRAHVVLGQRRGVDAQLEEQLRLVD